ncbi:thioredoxin [bacterium]|nr:thioredoxin [bacterium]
MIVNDINFQHVIDNHKLIMIDFWAEWCRPCKMFSPILDEVSKETGIWIGKINVDENPSKTLEYEVTTIPTTIIFKDGKSIKRIVGAKPKHLLMEEIKEWI